MRVQNKNRLILLLAVLTILVLILDTKTVLSGIQDGVSISIHTIIPSLFPFIWISNLLSSHLLGKRIFPLRPISKLCKIPDGAESLLLLGLLGGYPVGATIIANSYRCGQLARSQAQRMLGFCNNAGPSFIIGLLGPMFSHVAAPYILWFTHVFSAILVGMLLPAGVRSAYNAPEPKQITISQALDVALHTVARVCGWVILFRGLIAICEKWFLRLLTPTFSSLIVGILELSNGCISLVNLTDERTRYILSSFMLAAGGFCVVMQSKSVVGELGLGMFLPGKIMQTAICMVLSTLSSYILYGRKNYNGWINILIVITGLIITISVCLILHFVKKKDSILKRSVV